MKGKLYALASGIASFVLLIAVTANGTASMFGFHQPKEPSSFKK
jgi:cyclic lactone autoinducer peptide